MYYFIVNTKSGSGRAVRTWNNIKRYLKKEGVSYKAYQTKYEGHATLLANKLSKMKDDDIRIVIVGGDGTLNEVINGISDLEKVRVGLVPSGSGNDFARGLGIKGTKEEILKDVLSLDKDDVSLDIGKVIWQDEGEEKERLFAISSGIGLDALVCKMTETSKLKTYLNKLKLGKLVYLILTVESLFTMKTFNASVKTNDDLSEYRKTIFMGNMNMKAEGGGVKMAPNAVPYDGELDMCVASEIPKWLTFFCLPFLVIGKHASIKGIKINKSVNSRIVTDSKVALHADGEYLGDTNEVKYVCINKKLTMLNQIK